MKAARKAVVAIAITALSPGAGCSPGAGEAPLVRIGKERLAIASPEDDALWQVRDVAESAGTLWALTEAPPFVHVFGPEGDRIARFGHKGDGPGDLRFPRALWPDVTYGGVTVWDPGLGRAQKLSLEPAGTRAASRSIPTSGAVRTGLDDATFGNPFRARRDRTGAVVLAHYGDIRVTHPDQLWLGRLVRIGRGPGAEPETIVDFARDLPGAALRPGQRGQPLFLGPVPLWDICPDRRTAVLDPPGRNAVPLAALARGRVLAESGLDRHCLGARAAAGTTAVRLHSAPDANRGPRPRHNRFRTRCPGDPGCAGRRGSVPRPSAHGRGHSVRCGPRLAARVRRPQPPSGLRTRMANDLVGRRCNVPVRPDRLSGKLLAASHCRIAGTRNNQGLDRAGALGAGRTTPGIMKNTTKWIIAAAVANILLLPLTLAPEKEAAAAQPPATTGLFDCCGGSAARASFCCRRCCWRPLSCAGCPPATR